MTIAIKALRDDIHRILIGRGVPADEAAIGVDMCIDAELRGHSSHGVRLLRNVLVEYANGESRRAPVRVLHETPVSAQLDGGFHLSWSVHRTAVDIAAEKAAETGIAIVSVRNAGVSGALGYLVERVAARGLVALAMNSSPLTVVAPGAATPTLGTNPLAVGVPRASGSPLVLDMATSAIAFNQVMRLRDNGAELPVGVAVDAAGAPTIDPASAIDPDTGRGRVLPFGGHRGYGLALMLELLVSAAVTGRVAEDKRGRVLLEPADFSAVYIAYQPGLIGDPGAGYAATDRLVQDLIDQGARIPGEFSRARREACLRNGTVDLDAAATQLLASLSGAP